MAILVILLISPGRRRRVPRQHPRMVALGARPSPRSALTWRHRQSGGCGRDDASCQRSESQVQEVPSSACSARVVLSTNPIAGTQVQKGQTITLDVGSGTPNPIFVVVPSVVGFTLHDAQISLSDSGLQVDSIPASCNQPNGDVCTQTPPGLAQARKGSTVTLTVSNVPTSTTSSSTTVHVNTFPVPSVQDDTCRRRARIIQSFNLKCAPQSQFQHAPSYFCGAEQRDHHEPAGWNDGACGVRGEPRRYRRDHP